MSSITTGIDAIEECLDGLQRIINSLAPSRQAEQEAQRVHWLEGQIRARIAQLEALKLDLEAGLALEDLGYSSVDDLMEMLDDLQAEIRSFERIARDIRSRVHAR